MLYPGVHLYLFDLLLWFMIFITFKQALRKPYKVTPKNRNLGIFIITIYIIFSFWGDWFHYNKEIVSMHNGSGQGYEDVFNWIINHICFHYIVFRIIVWGGAFLLLYNTGKKLNLDIDLLLLFLGCGWLSLFAYARVTLAMTIMFWGYSIIFTSSKHKKFHQILGFIIICTAFFFHKTAAFGIAMILGGIVMAKINKKIVIPILVILPFLLVGVIRNYLVVFLFTGSEDFDSSLQMSVASGQGYLQKVSEESGLGAILRSFFEYSAYYLMAYLCILAFIDKRAEKMHPCMKTLSLICLLTIICASLFAFDLGLNTKVLYVRFLRFSIIPIILLMSYFYQIGFHRKIVKIVFISACCMTVYATLYTMYICYLGVDLVNM